MSKCVLVPISDGTEEIEAVCIIDTLRRAGAIVTVAAVPPSGADNFDAERVPLLVTASRGTKLVADKTIAECQDEVYDLIALPGGMPGAEHLRDSKALEVLLKKQQQAGRPYAAICAAPVVVLQYHNLLQGLTATCHPSLAPQLDNAVAVNSRVVVAGPCITSRGPGTAIEFALTLVAELYGMEKAMQIGDAMLAVWPAGDEA